MSSEGGSMSALSPLPLSGGRRCSHKKLRMVKKKTVKKMLKKMGLKMRGGASGEVTGDKVVTDSSSTGAVVPKAGGRRKSRKSRKSLFGMRF
jgi:hypothetical protein